MYTDYYKRGRCMDKYTLYLDESETANYNQTLKKRENTLFVIAGIICKNPYHEQVLKPKVNRIKELIWNRCDNDPAYEGKILHELEMSRALKKQYNNRKERNISMDVLQEKLYDGDIDKKEKFGLKIIP